MKFIIPLVLFFAATGLHAYNPVSIEPERPFVEIPIDISGEKINQSYLGTLEGSPDLFEFTVDESVVVDLRLKQRDTDQPIPFSLLAVMVDRVSGGVAEIDRMNPNFELWETRDYSQYGISLLESPVMTLELEPGTYKVEVSTPVNEGNYELDFNEETVDNNYFGTFGTVWQVQRHFGYSWFQYFLSGFFVYQVGIVLILLGIFYTYRRHKLQTHASQASSN